MGGKAGKDHLWGVGEWAAQKVSHSLCWGWAGRKVTELSKARCLIGPLIFRGDLNTRYWTELVEKAFQDSFSHSPTQTQLLTGAGNFSICFSF
jgi:hypothetical protein